MHQRSLLRSKHYVIDFGVFDLMKVQYEVSKASVGAF